MGKKLYILVLGLIMVIAGSINTLSIKWADESFAEGWHGHSKKFNHPFFQSALMFVGEFSCFIVFKAIFQIYRMKKDGREDTKIITKGNRDFNPFLLFIPAMCDLTATSVMFIGLNLTYASSFQMLRGSVIIFVGILSIFVFHRMLGWKQWLGIVFIIIGLALVGMADYLSKHSHDDNISQTHIVIGDILIVLAQIISAIQMVVQEKFVVTNDIPPMQAVGWEGIFGLSMIIIINFIFFFIRANPPITEREGDRLENAIDALVQMGNSWQITVASLLLIISIAFFNFAGVCVSKALSATTRMVLDSVRTIVIWFFSLAFLGQAFHWLQLIGYVMLLVGMLMYNNIIRFRFPKKRNRNEQQEESTANDANDNG